MANEVTIIYHEGLNGNDMSHITSETPLVVFGDDWGRHVSTVQHLFRHLIPNYPVIWVNSFGHRTPRLTAYDLRRAWQKGRAMVMGPHKAVSQGASAVMPARIIEPRVLPWHHIQVVHSWNTRSLLRDIRRALSALAPTRAPILITGTPAAVDVVGALGESLSVYFCIDDYGELPGVEKRIVEPLERRLRTKVDVVIGTSRRLVDIKRPASGRSFYVPQGVNYAHFAEARPVPAAMAELPRPIIGFAGGIGDCLDVPLIHKVARSNPSGSVALVGPVTIDIGDIQAKNIRVLGNQSYFDLPAYVQAFDVGIIPYVLNDWTRAVDPLKLLEYLAAGIPVVSAALPEVRKYEEVVAIASDHEDFVGGVARALDERSASSRLERQSIARNNTWAARASQLVTILEEVLSAPTL